MDGVRLDGIGRNCPESGSKTESGRNCSKSGAETGRNESDEVLGSRDAQAQAQSCHKEDLKWNQSLIEKILRNVSNDNNLIYFLSRPRYSELQFSNW